MNSFLNNTREKLFEKGVLNLIEAYKENCSYRLELGEDEKYLNYHIILYFIYDVLNDENLELNDRLLSTILEFKFMLNNENAKLRRKLKNMNF